MSQKNAIDRPENRSIFNYNLRSSSTPKPNLLRSSPRLIVENKGEDDNKALQAENEKLKQLNNTLHNEVKKLKSQLQQEKIKKLNKFENTFIREQEDQIKRLKMQLEEQKERYVQVELEKRKMADSMKQIKEKLQDKFKSSVMSLLETNISKMETILLSKSDQHIKQIEKLKDQTSELLKRIDKERYIKVQDARRLHNKLLSIKMLFEEQSTNLEEKSIAKMDRCFTEIQSVKSTVLRATDVLKKRNEKKLEEEEESYKYTNAFTSAGEGSVLDISKCY